MTKEHFFAMKRGVEASCRDTLMMSKLRNKPLAPWCAKIESEEFTLPEFLDSEALNTITRLYKEFDKVEVLGSTYVQGRYDYYDYTYLQASKKVVIDSYTVPEQIITKIMQSKVRKLLGVNKYGTLHCKVLDLFKKGEISWEEVVKAHETDECKL